MKTSLPPDLERKLSDFRRRVWIIKLAEGILAALLGIVLSYLVVFVLDRFWDTPHWARWCILLGGAATLGLGLPLKWHKWVWQQRRLEDSARLLRRKFPRLGDQLLGIVELTRMEAGTAGRSERLVQAAIAQTAEAVKERNFNEAVPDARHRQWGWAAAGVVALAMLAFVLVNAAARNALVRWIMPWSNTERFTFTDVAPLPAHLVVPYGEPFDLPVTLASNTQWSPQKGWGQIGDQPPIGADLAKGTYAFTFPPQKKDADLTLSLGDARKNIHIEPKVRPELAEITVRLKLPSYLGYSSEQTVTVHGGSVGVVKGAEAAFAARATRNLVSAELDGKPQAVTGDKIETDFVPVTEDVERKFTWKDQDGLTPREPLALKLQAMPDEAPRVVARRDSNEQVVLDSETVTIDLSMTDDFGVKEAGLEWVGIAMPGDNGKPAQGSKIVTAGGNEKRELTAKATFCATREGVPPQTIELRAWVVDYLPGREPVRSAPFLLHILNKTDHALWLTEQFGKWLESAKESYEREQQLNQTNKDLRSLSAAELDRPENRRKIAQQAAAENANAARLSSLNQSGRDLVRQAMKNDEFDAGRLESWATMLKSLQDIAANRMPNVSDLLKQTAGAPSGAPTGTPPTASSQPQQTPSSKPPEQTPPNSKSAPNVASGATPPGNPQTKPIDPNAPPKPAAPSISDREASLGGDQPPPPPPNPNATPSAPGGGKLRLPTTTLGAAPGGKNDANPPASPAQQTMNTAVKNQDDLLAEFAKVSGQLSDILTSLEASTFVKRFKAASREQMKLATTINQQTLDAFGIEHTPVEDALSIADSSKKQSEVVGVIQSDLDAYFQRKQDNRFKATLEEMKKSEIVRALAGDGDKLNVNLTGQAMHGSQFWADTLDRWAEELVAASKCKSSSSCSGDSLPPEIVLKVMQSLRDEMKLRDSTREAENAKPAQLPEIYTAQSRGLADTQVDISNRTSGAVNDILALPEGETKFGKEIALLRAVVNAMDDAHGTLDKPDTGAPAIAAETEAIELLLQSKRQGKNPGGGGGSNPGGGGTANSASTAALADMGPGGDAESVIAARPVGQATGVAGREFPDEFKTGLDSYFNLLEKQPKGP